MVGLIQKTSKSMIMCGLPSIWFLTSTTKEVKSREKYLFEKILLLFAKKLTLTVVR